MIQIDYSEKITKIAEIYAQDLMEFIKQIMNSNEFDGAAKIVLNRIDQEDSLENDKMTNITVNFQVFGSKESGAGTEYKWVRFRAKDFSCSNSSIQRVTAEYLQSVGRGNRNN